MTARAYRDEAPIEHDGKKWIYSNTKEFIDRNCKCQGCESQYKIDLIIPNDLWEKIKPKGKSKGAGLLCGSCIMKRLGELFEYDVFELRRTQ